MRLHGLRALVTGATSGIGEAIAIRFVSEGAQVVAGGRDESRGAALVARLDQLRPGAGSFVAADLGTTNGPDELGAEAERRLGGVDLLVNNAAIWIAGPADQLDGDILSALFTVNVIAPYRLCARLVPKMAERGGGVVVNVTSGSAYRGLPGFAAYGASKAALDAATKGWASEFGRRGVRVNAVSPGQIVTPGVRATREDMDAFSASFGVGHAGDPEDVAAVVAFLASPEAHFIQGSTLHVDGGLVGTFGYQPLPVAITEPWGSPAARLDSARGPLTRILSRLRRLKSVSPS